MGRIRLPGARVRPTSRPVEKNRSRWPFSGAGAILALVVLAGCRGEPVADLGPALPIAGPASAPAPDDAAVSTEEVLPSPPVDDRYRIRTGDVITISILGEQDMTRKLPVGPDGRISYYVAHDIVAAGRTFAELRQELRRRLATHFKDPEVGVFGEAYTGNTVTVLGMVRKPGKQVVGSDTRLLDVIAMAGGISHGTYYTTYGYVSELPDLKRAFVLRGDSFVNVDFVDLLSSNQKAVARNNVSVRAGDRVYIPSSAELENKIIVLGEVRSPKVVRFQRDISFLEATASAGGVLPGAWERRAFVVRGSLRRPTVIPINMREIAMGAAPDLPLRSGDIVYIPKTFLGKASEITRQILPLLDSAQRAKTLFNIR